MKNTMKIKSLLSFFVPAAMMSLAVAGCSDYDNGYSEQAIKFAQDFRKTFGDIDPEQDWNLAERQFVTVSTQTESEVKIYAKVDDAYAIVGDYEGIKGTRTLGYDVVEGTTEIIVSDGKEGIKTTANGVVVFGQGTRGTAWEGTTEGVTVTKLTGTTEINGVTYPGSKSPTDAEIQNVLTQVPEMQNNISKGGIYSDFHYTSTGSFIIYPYYWNTSSINTVGIYYTDKNGEYHEVDIYTADGEVEYQETYSPLQTAPKRPNDWGIKLNGSSNWETVPNDNFHLNNWSTETDASGLRPPFIEYWKSAGNALGTAQIEKTINAATFDTNKHYLVMIEARLMNESGNIDETGSVTFYANDASIVMTSDAFNSHDTYQGHSEIYSDMDGTKRMWVRCKPDSNGKIKVGFNLENIQSNWFAFNNLKVFDAEHLDPGYLTGRNDNFYQSTDRGQGIRVDIPEGVTFGMYVKKTDTSNTYGASGSGTNWTLYSDKQKNIDAGYEFAAEKYCYASTFYMGDQMFIGLEDWPNGDCDLNDFVLAFDGCKPIIINEDPKTSTWLVACEDLGGTFDIDYNDIVFSVEHISGQTTAKLTPLAAGGTLASYIFFQDPLTTNGANDKCFGEIHQLFGVASQASGSYDIINANSRYEKSAPAITFNVDKDWTMAYYSIGEDGGTAYSRSGQSVNMGGFEIRTLPIGEDSPATLSIDDSRFKGRSIQPSVLEDNATNVPFILCIPYPYTRYNYPTAGKKTSYVWAWPIEYQHITDGTGPYPDFGEWVTDHTKKTDWYKNKTTLEDYEMTTVDELILSSGDMTQAEKNGDYSELKPSPLSNRGKLTIQQNALANDLLFGQLVNANYSKGELHYFFLNDGENQTEQAIGANWHPGVVGERTIIVRQDADDVYQAGETRFRMEVVENIQQGTGDAGFGIQAGLAPNPRGNGNWRDGDNHTIYMVEGQTLVLSPYLNYDATGIITVSEFNAGGTQSTISKSVGAVIAKENDNVTITAAANSSGIGHITLHYAGDAKTAAKDITYTLQIASATRYQIKVASSSQTLSGVNGYSGSAAGFWLNKDSNADRLLLNQHYGEPWILEQVPGNTGYYYLYHANNNKYVYLNNSNAYSPAFTSDSSTPGERGMFAIESGGKIKCMKSGYLGNNSDGYVYMDKGNYVSWTLETASYAKKRNAKRR